MFPLTEENKHVAQLLLNTGTCPRCIFRFCGVDFHAPYKLPYKMKKLRYREVKQPAQSYTAIK
ncbi:pseudouridine synthase 10 [Homo sapiens]|uniref:Pseudouridine synthase 10 n=1 Tax=Homo sapiens TaxID=9606 RepID=A8MUL8_HUMAN|nr:pseudouridine synthase 10 [Homo sapiens]KAI2523537.1 pseudouridine synthase 10 [Homo sapiens]KAI4034684.1 pseudouridine synthase 10 [Homo sapiens]KAI4034685.1 pseudouridine synthase 10 [Homo sapiens]